MKGLTMGTNTDRDASRREFLKKAGRVAAASALAGVAIPAVHAAENNTIRLALVGCGGRGTGAAANALATKSGPIKLVAMADVFEHRLKSSYRALKERRGRSPLGRFAGQPAWPVSTPRRSTSRPSGSSLGFDAYQKAMDCLGPGDIVILTTPCAFRWVHFSRAIEKGLNVFMEKPTTVDGPSSRKMLALAERSAQKNLKVGVGLMCRHCKARLELVDRIRSGQIGDITFLRTYRLVGPAGFTGPKPADLSELLYQVQRYLGFLWASGGLVHDYTSHNIDECCWMKGSWPVQAEGFGGRYYRGDAVDQNFDHCSVEYTFADGARLLLNARNMAGCYGEFASYAHGTKGSAVISTYMHTPAKCRIYKGQSMSAGRSGLGVSPARAQSVPTRVGPPGRSGPARQAVQRSAARRRGKSGPDHGPDGMQHGPGGYMG